MESRLFRIEGRVQGVWFRESTRQEALTLGIAGYARNMADGSVQVLARGETEALNRLAKWLEQGPPLAQVTRVSWVQSEDTSPQSFTTG